jgi:hypothetical protein
VHSGDEQIGVAAGACGTARDRPPTPCTAG